MKFNYQLTGTIDVTEGSRLNATGTAIILPDGKTLRLWEAWEYHLADEDDHTDLSYGDLVEIGIHYDTLSTAFEET